MKVETRLAQNADHEQQLLWLGRSGVEYARWILAQQASIAGEPYDSLNQIWAGGPGGPGETNSVLAGISMDNFPVGDGTISLKITDLERKANINTATTPELQQALTLMAWMPTAFPSCPTPSRTGLTRTNCPGSPALKTIITKPVAAVLRQGRAD